MQQPSKLQISDLEPNQSDIEQKITLEEAQKVVGGSILVGGVVCAIIPLFPEHPSLLP